MKRTRFKFKLNIYFLKFDRKSSRNSRPKTQKKTFTNKIHRKIQTGWCDDSFTLDFHLKKFFFRGLTFAWSKNAPNLFSFWILADLQSIFSVLSFSHSDDFVFFGEQNWFVRMFDRITVVNFQAVQNLKKVEAHWLIFTTTAKLKSIRWNKNT